MERVELLVLNNLLYNERYTRKVIPFIKEEYFEQNREKIIFQEIFSFIDKYSKVINKESLLIEVENRTDINEETFKEVVQCINTFEETDLNEDWLMDTTEKWCRDRAIYLALMDAIQIADGNDEKRNRDAIPSILSDALSVSFNSQVGHDYLEDYEERYDFYHQKEEKIPFDLEYFNKITKGGFQTRR